MSRYAKKRLSMDLPHSIHDMLKIEAAQCRMTITQYVLHAVVDRIKLRNNINEKILASLKLATPEGDQ